MRGRISLLGLLVALSALCLSRGTPAQATTTRVDTPFTDTIIDPCTGELVDISGVSHTVIDLTLSADNNFVMGVHQSNHNVTGVGRTTGTTYTGSSTAESQSFAGAVPATFTLVGHVALLAKGSAPDFRTDVLEVFTIDANGTITVSIANFSSTCQ